MAGRSDPSASYIGFYAFGGIAGILAIAAIIFVCYHRCRRRYDHERVPADVVAVEMRTEEANRPAQRPRRSRYPEAQPSNHHVEILAKQPPVAGNVILRDRDDLLQLKGCLMQVEEADEDRTETGNASPALPNASMMQSFALGNSFFYRTGANSLEYNNNSNSYERSPMYSGGVRGSSPGVGSPHGVWDSAAGAFLQQQQQQQQLPGLEQPEEVWRVASSLPIHSRQMLNASPKPPRAPPPVAASADFIFTVVNSSAVQPATTTTTTTTHATTNVSAPSATDVAHGRSRLLVPLREVSGMGSSPHSGGSSPSSTPRDAFNVHGLYDGGLLPPLSPPVHEVPPASCPLPRFPSSQPTSDVFHGPFHQREAIHATTHFMEDPFSSHGLHLDVPRNTQTHSQQHQPPGHQALKSSHHHHHHHGEVQHRTPIINKKKNKTRRLRDISKGGYLVYEREVAGEEPADGGVEAPPEEVVELPDGLRAAAPTQTGNSNNNQRKTKKFYLQKASSFDVYGRGAYLDAPTDPSIPEEAFYPPDPSSSSSSSSNASPPYSPVSVSASSMASSRPAEPQSSPLHRPHLTDAAGGPLSTTEEDDRRGADGLQNGGTHAASPASGGMPSDYTPLCSPTPVVRDYLFPAPHDDDVVDEDAAALPL